MAHLAPLAPFYRQSLGPEMKHIAAFPLQGPANQHPLRTTRALHRGQKTLFLEPPFQGGQGDRQVIPFVPHQLLCRGVGGIGLEIDSAAVEPPDSVPLSLEVAAGEDSGANLYLAPPSGRWLGGPVTVGTCKVRSAAAEGSGKQLKEPLHWLTIGLVFSLGHCGPSQGIPAAAP